MNQYEQVSYIFEAMSAPARLQILLAIGTGEACVCHLEAQLGLRQAYISQQLMVLREKELITSRRDGKYIYYRLLRPELLEVIHEAAHFVGIPNEKLTHSTHSRCECPKCEPGLASAEFVSMQNQAEE